MYTSEGVASVADAATGALLFYTDGVTIWNRDHRTMMNGFGLTGYSSTTQSALIVPMPGDSSRYYVFSNGPYDMNVNPSDGMITGIRYSIVDMRLDNGNGGVAEKNISLIDSTTEKMHAVAIRDGNEFWMVTHLWNSNQFCAFRISASGISAPVFSASGPWIYRRGSSIGCLKLSSNGRYLALSLYDMGGAYLFDFDIATGKVSNGILLSRFAGYGVCFSSDCSKLYCGGGELVQYDLVSGDSARILASRYPLVPPYKGPTYGTLTLGPDGRIYCAPWTYQFLSVIDYPNASGAACGMKIEGIELDRRMEFGLPNMIEFIAPRMPDTVKDLNYYELPWRCPGHAERVRVPFYNMRTTDSAVEITFQGERAGDYTLDTALPFALTPTSTITFPVIHRSTVPGRWTTRAVIRTSAGVIYFLDLHATTHNVITPVLDVSRIHLGEHGREFDTCISITNTYHEGIVLNDMAWRSSSARHPGLISTALPIYLAPMASASLCIRMDSLVRGDTFMLTITGTTAKGDQAGRCVMQLLTFDALGPATLDVPSVPPLMPPASVQCVPNPASGTASVTFTVGEPGNVLVRLLSLDGAEIATLVDAPLEAGSYSSEIDVAHIPSGVYVVHAELPDGVQSVMLSIVH